MPPANGAGSYARPDGRHGNAQGRTLGIRRDDNGHWEPPGGLLELDEGIHEGLTREVLEETGLLVEPVALTGA